MSVGQFVKDRLQNVVANLGTKRDKASHVTYAYNELRDEQLFAMYRTSWAAAKIVDIPALDSCRAWRDWQASQDQIEKIEEQERRLGLQQKVLEAQTLANLLGGAAIFIGTGEENLDESLDPSRVGADGLHHLTVLDRRQLSPGDVENDVFMEGYGKPKFYSVAGKFSGTQSLNIHPSRLALFYGKAIAGSNYGQGNLWGWGDSLLQSTFEAVSQNDSAFANVVSLLYEAKVDVIQIPGMMESLKDPEYASRLVDRFTLAMTTKGNNGVVMLDGEEVYSSKTMSFGSIAEILDRFNERLCAASDIPATRFMSQSPGGMNASGNEDTRNHYDRISSRQELTISPALSNLDECLIYSALGSRPAEIFYEWSPLWQISETERATIGKTNADAAKTLHGTGLIADEALSEAVVNQLTEGGIYPGLDQSVGKFVAPDFDEGDDVTPALPDQDE